MNKDYTWFENYTWQYLDILNCRFLEMDNEKRLKNIPVIAKRLAERGEEYTRIRKEIQAAAIMYGTHVDNIKEPSEYPEIIIW
ncbi:hypothetical protein AB6A23_03820 [Paenibacillus tarimensis]